MVASVMAPLNVSIPHAQHALVLIGMVVHVDHHGQLVGWRGLAGEEARALREEEDLRVGPLHVVHHTDGHLGAIVRPVWARRVESRREDMHMYMYMCIRAIGCDDGATHTQSVAALHV